MPQYLNAFEICVFQWFLATPVKLSFDPQKDLYPQVEKH